MKIIFSLLYFYGFLILGIRIIRMIIKIENEGSTLKDSGLSVFFLTFYLFFWPILLPLLTLSQAPDRD